MRSGLLLFLLAPLLSGLGLLAASRGEAPSLRAPERPGGRPIPAPGAGVPRSMPKQPATAPSAVPGLSPWSSPEACLAALATRPARPAGLARVATWNVRWFPDGVPGKPKASPSGRGPQPTHLDWLACAIAWLGVDVLALQEVKSTPEASRALIALRARLDGLTGGSFRAEIDRCPGGGRQSVALLFDERRVSAGGFQNLGSLNPRGEACEGQLRPGFGGYFRFMGGLDLHLVAVHLKSGPERHALDLRRSSLQGIPRAFLDAQGAGVDEDLLVLGDFNTMGCPDCSPKIAAAHELAEFDAQLAALSPPFERVPAALPCTEYYRGKGTALDHVVVRKGTRELAPGTFGRVEGYCAAASCRPLPEGAMPRAYRELSDHCPVVLDLVDADRD